MADPYAPYATPSQEGPTPKQSKASAEAQTSGAEARYADMAKGAEARKKQAEADIVNATSVDAIREARARADKAEVDLQAARDALAKGPPKSVTEIELDAKAKSAKSRAAVVRAQMLNNIQLYKNEIKGQPASRLFGYTEQFDKPSFGGVVPAIPAYENFTKANAAILPLIRPLVAQSSKEGDSDKEMQVFMAFIPEAGDSDRTIETKYSMLDILISGMADGRPPSEITALGVKPRGVDDVEMAIRRELAPNEVKGYRLSATTEGKIRALYADKQLTPEAYADLVVSGAVEAGLKPDEAFKADALAKGAEAVGNMEKGIQWGGFSYGDVDEAAKEGLAWPEAALSGAINLPYSALETFAETGKALTVGLPETVQTIGKLAGDAIGVTDGETLQALGEFYANRYGTEQGFKEAIAQNPFEVLLDASTVSGVLGKVGKLEAATKLSNALDPVALSTRVAKFPFQTAAGAGRLAREGATEALGVTTGAGGDALREAAKAGREGGEGAKTFLENMRGGGNMEDVLGQARDAMANMRKDASEAYRTGMLDVTKDKSIVDFTPIYERLGKLRERAYLGDKVKNPSAAAVYEKAKAIVDEWNTSDPAVFHTPEGMDGLKQRIGDLSNDFATENNRRAASIASGVYDEVRKSINNQVPSYAKVMEGYETATKTMRDIENTLSLKPGAQVDTSLRKLQSIMRNNANTNYGRRVELGRTLEEAGAEGLFPSLAGQQLSAKTPRGLGQVTAGGSILGAIPTGGASLIALPLASPRLVGEGAFKAGQAAGAAERAVTPFMQSMAGRTEPLSNAIMGLAEKYNANRLPIRGGMAAIQGLEGAQMQPEEQINVTATEGYPAQAMADLAARYAVSPVAETAAAEAAPIPEEGALVDPATGRTIEQRADGRYYFKGTNELAYPDLDPLLDRSNPARGMYRGGRVQPFKTGGRATIADMARHYGARR